MALNKFVQFLYCVVPGLCVTACAQTSTTNGLTTVPYDTTLRPNTTCVPAACAPAYVARRLRPASCPALCRSRAAPTRGPANLRKLL
jgi:hypothetical protein